MQNNKIQPQRQLDILKECYNTLRVSFQNNLKVIQEQEQEISSLTIELKKFQEAFSIIQNQIIEERNQHQFQLRSHMKQYEDQLIKKDRDNQQISLMIENKIRKQMQVKYDKLSQQTQSLKNQLEMHDQIQGRYKSDIHKLNELIKTHKQTILDLQQRIAQLTTEKNSYANKMALHLQELQSVRNCNTEWQQTLKDKLKEAQKQKQAIEQELSEAKQLMKQKLRRQKQQYNNKILQVIEQQEANMRDLSTQSKEIKYKYEREINSNNMTRRELELLRADKQKIELQFRKYQQNSNKSVSEKTSKQYECIIKMYEADKENSIRQLQMLADQKKQLKRQIDQLHEKKEHSDKAVERLKYQLLNKTKSYDQLYKKYQRLKVDLQNKDKQIENHQINEVGNSNRQFRPTKDEINEENVDFSKVFTEDIGFIDDKFFESPSKSPQNKNKNNREILRMKKISELQLQLQQQKNLIKQLRSQNENIKKYCQEDKQKQISVYRDKANIYWEKANDKQNQVMLLRQANSQLKQSIQQLTTRLRQFKDTEESYNQKQRQNKQLKEEITKLTQMNKSLKQQVGMLEKEKDILEDISTDLRAELHAVHQIANYSKMDSIHQIHHSKQQERQYAQNHRFSDKSYSQLDQQEVTTIVRQTERPKIPKKLHDLVKQKKQLEITGKRAMIEQRSPETRVEHLGTDSQKQILGNIKIKNKTPPKATNYFEMKQQKQRRTQKIQTASQKEMLERLKSRQITQVPPERGVNYLQMRNQLIDEY